ncbi:MAG: hypothetical protein PQJ49_01500 [Sphaerochaetaceae bacterium]|nr:hypothetical protein [Sphaerochaetaceae bacterium]
MSKENKKGCSINIGGAWILGLPTAIIGHHIHGSIAWAIFDFLFYPIAWIKWLICQDVNMTIIKEAFDFFLK